MVEALTTDLSPLSAPGLVGEPVKRCGPAERFSVRGVGTPKLKPPRGLYIPRGGIINARFGGISPSSKGSTAAQRLGLAYETRVHDVLSSIYEIDYKASPSILFEDRKGLHRAIPDGLLKLGSRLVIVEIKLTHTERAWWQLSRLYYPILSTLVVPGTRIYRVEICRSYDPSIVFPERHDVVESLHRLPIDRVGVLQWKI